MILRIIGRLILVPLALLMATGVSALVLMSISQERLTVALRGGQPDEAVIGLVDVLLKLGLVLLNPVTLVLPLLIVVAGEVGKIRSASFYVASFGLLSAAIPLLGRIGAADGATVPIWAIFATAGFAGGFVYWLLAGRSA